MLKSEPDNVVKARIIHSAILRLRQAYSIKRLYYSDVPELSMEFRGYFNDNFEELYELYRVVRDVVHGNGLNEEELPEKVRTLTKSKLSKLVNAVNSYIKEVYEKIVGDYLRKQGTP